MATKASPCETLKGGVFGEHGIDHAGNAQFLAECGDQTKVIEVTDRDSGSGHDDLPAKESNRSEWPIAVKYQKCKNQVRNDGLHHTTLLLGLQLQLHLMQILLHLQLVVSLIGELGAVARRNQVHRGAEQSCCQQPLANPLRVTTAPTHQQQQDREQGVGEDQHQVPVVEDDGRERRTHQHSQYGRHSIEAEPARAVH